MSSYYDLDAILTDGQVRKKVVPDQMVSISFQHFISCPIFPTRLLLLHDDDKTNLGMVAELCTLHFCLRFFHHVRLLFWVTGRNCLAPLSSIYQVWAILTAMQEATDRIPYSDSHVLLD